MQFKDAKSILELDHDGLYFSLCKSIQNPEDVEKLTRIFKKTTTEFFYFFEDEIFTQKKYQSEDNPDGHHVLEYLLPTVKKVYINFFINIPTIFKYTLPGNFAQNRLELFQLQFNLKELLNYISEKYKKNYDCLKDFENIDKDTEILTIITEDYLAQKIAYVLSVNFKDIVTEIRDSKINKQLEF
jgi:hypothetical protein